jgi:hypothetical protein
MFAELRHNTYEIHLGLPCVFYRKRERRLEPSVRVSEQQESLVWSFAFAIFCRCQDYLKTVSWAQYYRILESRLVRESAN